MADYPPSWRFDLEADSEVEGQVTDRRTYEGGEYGAVEILELDTSTGRWSVWMQGSALKGFVKASDPQPGDYVHIVYLGREPILNDDGTPWDPDGNGKGASRKLFKCEKTFGAPAAAAIPVDDARRGSQFPDDDDIPF